AVVREAEERRRGLAQESASLERKLAKCQAAVQELTQLTRDVAGKEERHAVVQRDLAALPTGYDAKRHATRRQEAERLALLESRATRLAAQTERGETLTL